MSTQASSHPSAESAHLVLALVSIDGSTAACADHGDIDTLQVLTGYYTLVGAAIEASGGRVVKVMGDGVLAAFAPECVTEAVNVCREVQAAATAHGRLSTRDVEHA